jgi:putative FmdB family regulatory protein
MPTYDYECETCDKIFEVFQNMSAPKLEKCLTCGSPIRRLIGSGAGLIFKGGGFYETDFKTKSGTKPTKEGKPPTTTSTAPASSSTGSTGESGGAKGDTTSSVKPGSANVEKK